MTEFVLFLQSQDVIDKVKSYWEEEKDYTSKEVTLTCDPFRLCRLQGLLENPDIINNIVDDMNTLDWSRKKMDLYEFHQTTDLANLTWQRSIRGIYDMLKTEIMTWVGCLLYLSHCYTLRCFDTTKQYCTSMESSLIN